MADASPLGNLIGSVASSAPSTSERAAPTGAAPAARRVPQPRPDGDVDLRLRNGRRVRARIAPAVARRDDLAAVAKAAGENDRKAAGALRRHRAAITNLRRSHAELTKKVEELERRANLLGGLAPGMPSLEERVRDLQALSVKTQIQSAGTVLNSLQASAYGDKGSLLTTNNMLIAGNQLFWTLLDPVLRATGAVNTGMATVIGAAAPIASLFTGEILVGNRQQARFISGVTTFTAPGTRTEILVVAEHLRESFRARTDLPVTVSALDQMIVPFSLTGRVVEGVLEIQLLLATPAPPPAPRGTLIFLSTIPPQVPPPPPFTPVRVAWTVDLGEDFG